MPEVLRKEALLTGMTMPVSGVEEPERFNLTGGVCREGPPLFGGFRLTGPFIAAANIRAPLGEGRFVAM